LLDDPEPPEPDIALDVPPDDIPELDVLPVELFGDVPELEIPLALPGELDAVPDVPLLPDMPPVRWFAGLVSISPTATVT
jgi:hypothetical protein